jgi:uncharacterized protein YjiS (DUF1127 family)
MSEPATVPGAPLASTVASLLVGPIAWRIEAAGLRERLALARLRRREFRAVRAELERYSERELNADLGLSRSAIPEIAAEAADRRVAAFVRAHPEYREGWGGCRRREVVPGWP